jgi:Clathrin adaptor complex small chain
MVLSFILIQNRQGKTRLAKWYAPYTDEEKVKLKGEVLHYLVSPFTLFKPSDIVLGSSFDSSTGPEVPIQLCRVSLRSFGVRIYRHCSSESFFYQNRI